MRGAPATPSLPVRVPRPFWVLVCATGVLISVVFALVPVSVEFGDDPLIRLGQLDPELSPPEPSTVCGSPLRSLDVAPRDTSFYERARAAACERVARRRLLSAVAGGSVIVMVGLLGLATTPSRRSAELSSG